MRCLLFRKARIADVDYYQLYKVDEDFKNEDSIPESVDRDKSDYFYIEDDERKITWENDKFKIWYDVNGEFTLYDNPHNFVYIINQFNEKYHSKIMVREVVTKESLIREIKNNILYEDEAIEDFVNQLYLNQTFLTSGLSDNIKRRMKNNILLHGIKGTGKNTIVDIVKENIGIPCVDITLSTNDDINIQNIAEELLLKAGNTEEASNGIVFIRDNFEELIKFFKDEKDIYEIIEYLTSRKIIDFNGNKIDFSKLTFVILYNQEEADMSRDELLDLSTLVNCSYEVGLRTLTDEEKYNVLLKQGGQLFYYARLLREKGKEIKIDESALKKLIKFASRVDKGMNFLNDCIEMIIKSFWRNDIESVYITNEVVDDLISTYPLDVECKIETKKDEIPSVKEAYKVVSKSVIGQEKQVKTILYRLRKNLQAANNPNLEHREKHIKRILVQAETGSGKSFIMETISKSLNVPLYFVDATEYTETGFRGADVEKMLVGLIEKADGNIERAQKGILVIDEIDKKANSSDSQIDISRGAVLRSLLKFFDGRVVDVNISDDSRNPKIVQFDTSYLSIVCLGAFEGLEKVTDKRIKKLGGGMGFQSDETRKIPDALKKTMIEDYVNYGMSKEFMGRIKVFIYLDKITEPLLIDIMKKSDQSALRIEQISLKLDGIDLEFTEDFYEKLAKRVMELKVGVRGIETALEDILTSINIQDIDEDEISKIILSGDVIDDPSKVILIKREKGHVKQKTMFNK